jgi:hypothetical protein
MELDNETYNASSSESDKLVHNTPKRARSLEPTSTKTLEQSQSFPTSIYLLIEQMNCGLKHYTSETINKLKLYIL